jgi:hypothetical protein
MSQSNPYLTIDQQIVGDAYTSTEAMDNLITLCDEFGSRFGGTEGERQAVEFFQAKMKAYGLSNVHAEPVEYVGWTRGEAKLEIVHPIQKNLPCISLPHSPPVDMKATLVDLGDGAPDSFDERADEIKGRFVMTTSVVSPKGTKGLRWIHRNEKYNRSLMAGAVGFLFVNHYPGYGPATGGIGHGGEGPIPGVSVAYEEGALLKRLMSGGQEVHIRLLTTDSCQPMTSWNVVGDLPGSGTPEQIVMVGSHYDGHDIAQGAADPASGAVSVLEAARLLAQYAPDLRCTVRFVQWGIEEIGLLGSKAYAEVHADELAAIRFYLNMDAAGARENNRDLVLNEWPDLAQLAEHWGREMAHRFEVGQSVSAHSDHYPFFMAGVPTGGIQSAERSLAGRGWGHTRYDTVDKVEQDDLREASTLAARLLLRIADAEDWPAAHRTKEEVREVLDSPEYQEEEVYRQRLATFYREREAE